MTFIPFCTRIKFPKVHFWPTPLRGVGASLINPQSAKSKTARRFVTLGSSHGGVHTSRMKMGDLAQSLCVCARACVRACVAGRHTCRMKRRDVAPSLGCNAMHKDRVKCGGMLRHLLVCMYIHSYVCGIQCRMELRISYVLISHFLFLPCKHM